VTIRWWCGEWVRCRIITQVGFVVYQPYVFGWGDNRAGQAVNLAWENTWMDLTKAPPDRK
jgi:hypothetical protein